ncbi:phosphate uptake regulator PhoU [Candidatus Woesearchaeota archaeon]|jgi:phosphate uptake regulator|nr:phosphate uptake regulator PhoU [Candidatus Woesearchaeota archaeon]
MKLHERKLQEISGSLLVSIPKAWANQFKLKKGSKVEIGEAEFSLQLAPKLDRIKTKSRELIDYDERFVRKFMRLYLKGTDEIVIAHKNSFSTHDKKSIQKNLEGFMNVQIIEEHSDKIVIQNFDITDLTIEQCLKRMYFLTKNMIVGVIEQSDDIHSIDSNLHKFYFLLVRLIRKDLDEGLYAEKKMHLIRYMDYRMASEKIERIGDLLKVINHKKKDKILIQQLKFIEKEYEATFNAFVKEDFKTAMELWKKRNQINKDFKTLRTEIAEIHEFIVQISKLIR